MASPPPAPPPPPPCGGVRKCGYLRKQKHGHRRFFVLREATERRPARLECYDSEKKWRARAPARRLVPLDSCLCVNKRADAKHKHLIALYTKDEYFAVAADSEHEQDGWFRVLSELIADGRRYDGPACTSSLVGFEESSYGPLGGGGAAAAAYREVWQVTVKSRGLGQTRSLTGVYRLCLSSRTLSLVKLNSDTAAVDLQLMNIRRCGHSDNFFFMEVGRSAATGPGEFWMQAEDSVVAQNIHETILDAMKAMKELSEFRPRSKSQSASTNPISVPGAARRNLQHLPPSCAGWARRSRTDGAAATSPGRKFTSCRVRTASEGDGGGGGGRPASVSVTGSPTSPGAASLSRGGRTCRMLEAAANLPLCDSPPAASSPISVSPRGGSGGRTPDKTRRPFSCSASISGSLGDSAGFLLCDEFGCSPAESRFLPLTRSDTPDSSSGTPPSRDPAEPYGYVLMEGAGVDRYRKRTHSLTTPRQQRAAAPLSSASLDEHTLMRMAGGLGSHAASPRVCYPEDYGAVEIGSSRSSSGNLGDDGYVPMTPGVAPHSARANSYVPMSPMCVSAPKQIVNPRVHPQTNKGGSPYGGGGGSLEDSGYMRMWCGSKSSMESPDQHGEYMNMSPGNAAPLQTPPDCYHGEAAAGRPTHQNAALPTQASRSEDDGQYVLMSPQNAGQRVAESDYYSVMQPSTAPPSPSAPSPVRHGRAEGTPAHRGRLGRPTRLSLDTLRTLPSMNEHPLPTEPRSPGEYINIQFGGVPTRSSLSDYINLDLGGGALREQLDMLPEASLCPEEDHGVYGPEDHARRRGDDNDSKDDYTDMTFMTPPQLLPHSAVSLQGSRAVLLSPEVGGVPEHMGVFLLGPSPSSTLDPHRSAKVIRAPPQGRRRHSSETFSSPTAAAPPPPCFPRGDAVKRHSSVENVSSRSSEGSDEEPAGPAPFPDRLDYIALNLLDGGGGADNCEELVGFKPATSCKGGASGFHGSPYVCLGFTEAATTAKD